MTREYPPLKVPLAVDIDGAPVLDALTRLHHDIGSIRASHLDPEAPPDVRLLCVALADEGAVHKLRIDLGRELRDKDETTKQLASRVAMVPLPLDAWLVIFRDILAVEL